MSVINLSAKIITETLHLEKAAWAVSLKLMVYRVRR